MATTTNRPVPLETLVRAAQDAKRRKGAPPVSVSALAETAGVSRPHLYALMSGAKNPSDYMLERLAPVLGVTVPQLRKASEVSRRQRHQRRKRSAPRARAKK
jgi:transcriptional regulator with XRE-family HTH domain